MPGLTGQNPLLASRSRDLHEEVRKGRDATALFAQLDPLADELRQDIAQELFATTAYEVEQRECLYAERKALDRIVGKLKERKATGDGAQRTIESMNQRGLRQG